LRGHSSSIQRDSRDTITLPFTLIIQGEGRRKEDLIHLIPWPMFSHFHHTDSSTHSPPPSSSVFLFFSISYPPLVFGGGGDEILMISLPIYFPQIDPIE